MTLTINLTSPEHEVTCTRCHEVRVCTCGSPDKHIYRANQGWPDYCPTCDGYLETIYKRFTNPDPLCPKCGQHRAFCKHSGFDVSEHVKSMPVLR